MFAEAIILGADRRHGCRLECTVKTKEVPHERAFHWPPRVSGKEKGEEKKEPLANMRVGVKKGRNGNFEVGFSTLDQKDPRPKTSHNRIAAHYFKALERNDIQFFASHFDELFCGTCLYMDNY